MKQFMPNGLIGLGIEPSVGRQITQAARYQLLTGGYNRIKNPALFHDHRRAVTDNLGDATHYLGGIITDTDDGICTHGFRMPYHQFERIFTGPLAELRVQGDVPSRQRLESSSDIAEN
jgi:hypothetical protein